MSDTLLIAAENELRALRVREALALFDAAERCHCDPDTCAAGRWECRMLLGDFESAWRESDSIHRRGNPDPNRFWDGRPLHGKRVLIRCLHGLGDTIQFIRFAPLVREIARSVTIEAQPKLKILLSQSALADRVITWSEDEPRWDQQVEVIELPRIFRTSLETLPRTVPYIHAGNMSAGLLSYPSNCLRVGIAWTSSTFNPARSLPIGHIARLFAIRGVSFFGLQSGPEHHELLPWSLVIRDLHDDISTIHDTAAILRQLDLVISVDTMTAHLAGALAVPVWTLLPYECDWRWMLHRDDSPWYPSMRLFRQSRPGDWSSVIDHVAEQLCSLAAGRDAAYSAKTAGTVK